MKLLEKGIAARPDKWEYMEDTGFVYYWYANDYRQAAAWFQKASDVPGAPVWLKGLAATTLAQGGDRQSSRTMWTAILETSEVAWMRSAAERVLLQLNALDQIDTLQSRLDAFARQRGAPPEDWATVVRARVFPGVPVDPSGTRYELTRDGRFACRNLPNCSRCPLNRNGSGRSDPRPIPKSRSRPCSGP